MPVDFFFKKKFEGRFFCLAGIDSPEHCCYYIDSSLNNGTFAKIKKLQPSHYDKSIAQAPAKSNPLPPKKIFCNIS
ncbi:hypothetical protein NIES39_M00340 [Arthrospira platensis NIES-39]|nr:hypothetical protein NIES39_M00340 [Arthrospira platensis NIES-39]